jgi:undecaprenyl diphosphate synthase
MGDIDDHRVPQVLRDRIRSAEELTADNDTMTMVFAFNYGGRVEIVDAIKRVAADLLAGELRPGEIDEETLKAHLYIPEMPDPDLVIRTSGEQRTSNFLLWEAAYSEYVFTPVLWPDFDRDELARCIAEYQERDRRFGGAVDESFTEPAG